MGYAIKYAQAEQLDAIHQSLNTRDSEALYHLAAQLKEEGDDEEAERLVATARQWDKEDWDYDNAIGN